MNLSKLNPWERGALSSSGHELHYQSPNKKYDVYLKYEGDIRMGPCYFSMIIGGSRLRNRFFGGEIYWSDDSGLFAAQEWLTTDEKSGPNTNLILFNPLKKTQAVIDHCLGGFTSALRFYPESITFHRIVDGARQIKNVAYSEIQEWSQIV